MNYRISLTAMGWTVYEGSFCWGIFYDTLGQAYDALKEIVDLENRIEKIG